MAMTSGGGGRTSSEINVTPLIDILLVLLIIFMVIVPVAPKGLAALVPQPPRSTEAIPSPSTIVVSVLHGGLSGAAYKINQEDVSQGELQAKLTSIYANRSERIMFVKGDDQVQFSQIAEVIDMGHSAGVDHVGLITPKIADGQ